MIELDGSLGEGGGQILRTSLSLAMITGQPFRMTNIRANRPKPGLMRQHLVAVQAAAQVCGADLGNLAIGAQTLEFIPSKIASGDFRFAIGSAGSCTLVLQTLIPALLFADGPSTITISGGTHNAMAPPAQFLQRAYGRVMAQMGAQIEIDLQRFGFYPAGGGVIQAKITPCSQLQEIHLRERGQPGQHYAECFIANLPFNVAQRELDTVGKAMGWQEAQLLTRGLPPEQGPGNALLLTLEYEHVTDVMCAFGEKTVSAETVAKNAVNEARHYIASQAALGEHLADQVMLPMALAGGGSFTTNKVSQHSLTNADVIAQFLPVRFVFDKKDRLHTCEVQRLDSIAQKRA